jgi:cystathionine beta-lyase
MDSFLVLRGIKTLHIRMQRHCENGAAVAHYLKNHPKVGKVYWPGFEEHPNHAIAKSQMIGFGGMLSFDLDGSLDAKLFQKKLNMIKPSMSLAGVESTVIQPSLTSHALLSPQEREALGISDYLIRLSVGLENKEDILEDIEQAIKNCI